MSDLPPKSVTHALALVDAVRTHSPRMVAHTLRRAAAEDGLEALAVSLAAMVDDSKPLSELLAWCDSPDGRDVAAWRNQLTDAECRSFHTAYVSGCREPETLDGEREYHKRRARKRDRGLRVAS